MNEVEKIDFLPLGSVVILRGGTQKVVVNARGLVTMLTDPPSFFDYGGSLYPQGIMGDQILYFNHKDIAKVVFKGFSDEDDDMMVANINEWFAKAGYEHGTPEQIARAAKK